MPFAYPHTVWPKLDLADDRQQSLDHAPRRHQAGFPIEANVEERLEETRFVLNSLQAGFQVLHEKGSLVQVLGNINGANDAPHEWYCAFDKVAQPVRFTRSKFDSRLYLCHNDV